MWNGRGFTKAYMEWSGIDMDPYVDPHVDFVAWFPTLTGHAGYR